jgi:hypothetical protein
MTAYDSSDPEASHVINVGQLPPFFRLPGIPQIDGDILDPQGQALEVFGRSAIRFGYESGAFSEAKQWLRRILHSPPNGEPAEWDPR